MKKLLKVTDTFGTRLIVLILTSRRFNYKLLSSAVLLNVEGYACSQIRRPQITSLLFVVSWHKCDRTQSWCDLLGIDLYSVTLDNQQMHGMVYCSTLQLE